MGLFDGILGGVVGSAMVGVVNHILEQNGGLQGVVNQFEQKGLGETVRSWVGTGQNLPITADQIHQVLGSGAVQELAQKAGLSVPELTQKLSQLLPQAIDKMTPAGVVPKT
ncbi:MAG: DUF937 domain-containing protein [Proteobacteria bacterium]|nr:DUF937 domain-containing protein [Pseudomonadota bacterium]